MANRPSIILGISYGHGDSSAALIMHGTLVAAAEEERFTRVKHYASFPTNAIAYCLRHAKLSPKDVQVVAIAKKPWNLFRKRLSLLWHHPHLWRSRKHTSGPREPQPDLRKMLKQAGLGRASIVRTEHHLAHQLSSRFLPDTDDMALLSLDGLGDFVSTAIGKPTAEGVEILDRVTFPHSLGYFYTAMTQYLGFPHFGDEFKVMGLSSYGDPKYLSVMREVVRESESFGFTLNLEALPILKKPIRFYIQNSQPVIQPFFNSNLLTQIIGVPPRKPSEPMTKRHWDLAKSVQVRFEEVANHLLAQLHRRVPSENLALSGGCAHNSVWVGKIAQQTPFKRVFVAPASHDAGIAVGAAIAAAAMRIKPEAGHWALLGPQKDEALATETESAGTSQPDLGFKTRERSFATDDKLIAWMVDELAAGKIMGLFRGRMEFGPRALGCRSIIADPRVPDMKDRLNNRVKHREAFRPFAASVLWEEQDKWFPGSFFCPAMEGVFEVKETLREKIPGVVHVDNSCRIQSVTKESQGFYWRLIQAFGKKTGVPMLINTSFNDCEPIVSTEKDAWVCFSNSDIDHLVLENKVISRLEQAEASAA